MARIRTIKPEFWEDKHIGKLPYVCRLFYIGLWNFADDYGFFEDNPVLLKAQIFPYDETLRVGELKKWIDALVEARMLVPISYKNESYYVIRTFRSHQVIDKRYDKCITSKSFANEVITRIQNDNTVNTMCTHSGHDGGSSQEKEMEMEKEGKDIVAASAAINTRKQKFYDSLLKFLPEYGAELLRQFHDYWTEPNKSKTKMRFELEKTWDVELRLKTWARNSSNFKKTDYAKRSTNIGNSSERDSTI